MMTFEQMSGEESKEEQYYGGILTGNNNITTQQAQQSVMSLAHDFDNNDQEWQYFLYKSFVCIGLIPIYICLSISIIAGNILHQTLTFYFFCKAESL